MSVRLGTWGMVTMLCLAGCGPKPIDPRRQLGPEPYLPPIHQYLLPPMHVAKIVGWNGATPTVAPGLKVQAFATGLANPRSCRMAMSSSWKAADRHHHHPVVRRTSS